MLRVKCVGIVETCGCTVLGIRLLRSAKARAFVDLAFQPTASALEWASRSAGKPLKLQLESGSLALIFITGSYLVPTHAGPG